MHLKSIRSTAIILCTFVSATLLQAQTTLPEMNYGKISNEELSMKQYAPDPSAEAVVIFDKGDSHFEERDGVFNVVFEKTTRIKILKEDGLKWAQFEIPLYFSNNIYEDLRQLKACSYTLNENEIINTSEFNNKDCKTEKINSNWVVKKIAIPNVKVGSVIEYSYQISSEYLFNLRSWEFQWKIPVQYSEYDVSLVPFFEYTYFLQGAAEFSSYSTEESNFDQQYGPFKYHNLKHLFVMKNLSAFKDQEYISSYNDYIIKLNFQLSKIHRTDGTVKSIITTWPDLKTDLSKDDDFGKYINKCKSSADRIIQTEKLARYSITEKTDSILSFVKANYKWNGIHRIYSGKSLSKLISDKTGSSAELNLMTIGLLKSVGISACPVLISTRNHGKINTQYPFFDSFNDVVIGTQTDSAFTLTDVTNPDLSNFRIPKECINSIGLMLDDSPKVRWINLHPNAPSVENTIIQSTIKDGLIKSRINCTSNEYSALEMKNKYGTNKTKIINYLNSKNYEVADSALTISPKKQEYQYSYITENKLEKNGNKLYLSPFLNEVVSTNPFKQKTRTYPIDLIYSQQKNYESTFEIPKGYSISYVPMNVDTEDDKFKLKYNIQIQGNNVKISFVYVFKKPEYSSKEYAELKDYFNQIITKSSDKIVFEKTN